MQGVSRSHPAGTSPLLLTHTFSVHVGCTIHSAGMLIREWMWHAQHGSSCFWPSLCRLFAGIQSSTSAVVSVPCMGKVGCMLGSCTCLTVACRQMALIWHMLFCLSCSIALGIGCGMLSTAALCGVSVSLADLPAPYIDKGWKRYCGKDSEKPSVWFVHALPHCSSGHGSTVQSSSHQAEPLAPTRRC